MIDIKIMKKTVILLMSVMLMGCSTEKTPTDLFQESKSGVVLILNSFYYAMALPGESPLYFTGVDENGQLENMTTDLAEIKANTQTIYGTGFFVDKQGTIMTNRHVAQPEIDKQAVKSGLDNFLSDIRSLYQARMNELSNEYDSLEAEKQNCSYRDEFGNIYQDNDKFQQIVSQQNDLQTSFNQLGEEMNQLNGNVSIDDIKIVPVCKIGIAYDNTYVTSESDFLDKNPCVVTRVSQDEGTDLALLQLKNKTTPETSYVFPWEEEDNESFFARLGEKFSEKKDKGLQIDQQLYMIGYNAGPLLASTKQGISVQMTSGKLTQMPDGDRLLYSIPTVAGSSGSPVIDSSGNLVAVNFAKLALDNNFNFGIPIEKIRKFMKQ
ncbi:MAG: serine protease [Prevotella sp.]|jgi:V8-like Glu-specific endopeptidase|nr:serine protease [Prevotella sp.]